MLDKKAKMPKSCRPLSVIPPAHMKWFEAIFKNNDRLAPPLPDGIGMIPAADLVVVITGNEKFMTKVVGKYSEKVLYVHNDGRENYTLTRNNLYVTRKDFPNHGIAAIPSKTPGVVLTGAKIHFIKLIHTFVAK